MCRHCLDASQAHFSWDRSLPPVLRVRPGDSVELETRDSSDGYYRRDSTAEDVLRKGPLKGHPLTGPIHVEGAAPGDILAVEILAIKPRADFGWTAIRPGRGLLPQAQFPNPFLQIWDLSDGNFARMQGREDVAVPIACFPGIIGTALADVGQHSTIPPRQNGGNMDFRHLQAGATVYLPVFVPGALLSIGDAHAAQGDGESCITAVEMAGRLEIRIDLIRGRSIEEPQFKLSTVTSRGTADSGPHYATLSSGPDLFVNAQRALSYMIDHLTTERGLSREQAYVLCSVCADLRITQIVDSPNWSVAAFLPEQVFH